MKPSQNERILEMLKVGPVCATHIWDAHIRRGAARIHDLKAQGHIIVTRRCENQWHSHGGTIVEYVLVSKGEQEQLF